jgi:hypothetical protein
VSKLVEKLVGLEWISANQILIGEIAALIAHETIKKPCQAFIASISAPAPRIFITSLML